MASFPRNEPAPPLGLVAVLTAGFEAVNARLELILLPLALDLFLWLGPHLSIKPLVDRFLALVHQLPSSPDPALSAQSDLAWAQIAEFGARFNLFSALSTFPLGLPSLLAARAAVTRPGGAPLVWPVESALAYAALFIALSLAGIFLGALYLGGIAQQVRDGRGDWGQLAREVWGQWAQLVALSALLVVLLAVVGLPLLTVAAVVAVFSPLVGSLVSFFGFTLVMWLLFYLAFALHGVVMRRRGLSGALGDSLKLVHRNLPRTAMLLLVLFVINTGLGLLWDLPADDSWLLLVGMGGHALVSTALFAATFVYYQDRCRTLAVPGPAAKRL